MRSGNLWLSNDNKNNKKFRELLDKTGYRSDEVVDLIFENEEEIYKSTAYYCMEVCYSN